MDIELQEINGHIKAGIKQWADVCLMADADEWAYYLNYDKDDVASALLIFQHVCMNIGIKGGIIDEKKAYELGERLRQLVIDMTGIDSHFIYGSNKGSGTSAVDEKRIKI